MFSPFFLLSFVFAVILIVCCVTAIQGQIVQHSPKTGVIVSSTDLALQSVQIDQAGNYTCIASNVEGDGESNIVELKVMCK